MTDGRALLSCRKAQCRIAVCYKDGKMNITVEEVIALKPCPKYTFDYLAKLFGKRKSLSHIQISNLSIPDEDKIWVLTRKQFLEHAQQIKFALYCAESVLPIWESKHPDVLQPRLAIEAAHAVLLNPSQENKEAARVAGAAADAAANTDAAADAAFYASANSAAHAANSAAYAAYAAAADNDAAYEAYVAAMAASAATAAALQKAQIKFLVKMIGDEGFRDKNRDKNGARQCAPPTKLVQLPFVQGVLKRGGGADFVYVVFTSKKHINTHEKLQISEILEGRRYELKYIGKVQTEAKNGG